jgi:hypothetical protein
MKVPPAEMTPGSWGSIENPPFPAEKTTTIPRSMASRISRAKACSVESGPPAGGYS